MADPYLLIKMADPYQLIKMADPYLLIKMADPYLLLKSMCLKAGKIPQKFDCIIGLIWRPDESVVKWRKQ